eukprot:5661470-Pyramimonas_sp.AAC.1
MIIWHYYAAWTLQLPSITGFTQTALSKPTPSSLSQLATPRPLPSVPWRHRGGAFAHAAGWEQHTSQPISAQPISTRHIYGSGASGFSLTRSGGAASLVTTPTPAPTHARTWLVLGQSEGPRRLRGPIEGPERRLRGPIGGPTREAPGPDRVSRVDSSSPPPFTVPRFLFCKAAAFGRHRVTLLQHAVLAAKVQVGEPRLVPLVVGLDHAHGAGLVPHDHRVGHRPVPRVPHAPQQVPAGHTCRREENLFGRHQVVNLQNL